MSPRKIKQKQGYLLLLLYYFLFVLSIINVYLFISFYRWTQSIYHKLKLRDFSSEACSCLELLSTTKHPLSSHHYHGRRSNFIVIIFYNSHHILLLNLTRIRRDHHCIKFFGFFKEMYSNILTKHTYYNIKNNNFKVFFMWYRWEVLCVLKY